MSKRPRDSQRLRTYKAGWAFKALLPEAWINNIHDIQAWVDEIVASQWWNCHPVRVSRVLVKDGRGRKNGGARRTWNGTGEIMLPRALRHKSDILHELAHLLVPNNVQSHGREFIVAWLQLVDLWVGTLEGDALRWHLTRNGAKWGLVINGRVTFAREERRERVEGGSRVIVYVG